MSTTIIPQTARDLAWELSQERKWLEAMTSLDGLAPSGGVTGRWESMDAENRIRRFVASLREAGFLSS